MGLAHISIEEVQAFMAQIPFNRYLGIELEELRTGYARMGVPFRDELIGDFVRGALHGGVLSALIDTCGGGAIWTQTAAGDRLSTVDLRVDYLLPGRPVGVICEGRVLRLGNRVGVADMRAYHVDRPEETIATGKGVYNVSRSRVRSADTVDEP